MAGMPMEYLNIHTKNFTNFRNENNLPKLNMRGEKSPVETPGATSIIFQIPRGVHI